MPLGGSAMKKTTSGMTAAWQSIPAHFQTDQRNGYYASWVSAQQGRLSDRQTRFLCNPAGYDGKDHDPRLLMNLPAP